MVSGGLLRVRERLFPCSWANPNSRYESAQTCTSSRAGTSTRYVMLVGKGGLDSAGTVTTKSAPFLGSTRHYLFPPYPPPSLLDKVLGRLLCPWWPSSTHHWHLFFNSCKAVAAGAVHVTKAHGVGPLTCDFSRWKQTPAHWKASDECPFGSGLTPGESEAQAWFKKTFLLYLLLLPPPFRKVTWNFPKVAAAYPRILTDLQNSKYFRCQGQNESLMSPDSRGSLSECQRQVSGYRIEMSCVFPEAPLNQIQG